MLKNEKLNLNLTSPCDGRVLSFGKINSFDELVIVKKTVYKFTDFIFGAKSDPKTNYEIPNLDQKNYYFICIYLSPSDIHRFYSPTNLRIKQRIHIPGYLNSVHPRSLAKDEYILLNNERVTMITEIRPTDSKKDLLLYTCVGAVNIGCIELPFDKDLKTNDKKYLKKKQIKIVKNYEDDISFNRGEEIGWFNFGSTIVLTFSSEKNRKINFKFQANDKVKINQQLVEFQ